MFLIQKDQVPVLCLDVPYVRRCVHTVTHIVNNGISLNFNQEYIIVPVQLMYEYYVYTFLCIDVSLKPVGGFVFMDNLTVSFCASVGVYQ
jgi:hypothetical protein